MVHCRHCREQVPEENVIKEGGAWSVQCDACGVAYELRRGYTREGTPRVRVRGAGGLDVLRDPELPRDPLRDLRSFGVRFGS